MGESIAEAVEREALFAAILPILVRNTPPVGRSLMTISDEIVDAVFNTCNHLISQGADHDR